MTERSSGPGEAEPSEGADAPDRPATLALLESLGFYRNAKIGLAVGVAFAAAMYLVRVLELLGPLANVREYPLVGPEAWFLLLAFVLAGTFALLVTILLTIRAAIRAVGELD